MCKKRKIRKNRIFTKYSKTIKYRLSKISYTIFINSVKVYTHFFTSSKLIRYLYNSKLRDDSSQIPNGFEANKNVEGKIELRFLDFYDYLPKEDLKPFIQNVKRIARINGKNIFSIYKSQEELDNIYKFGSFFNGYSFSNLITCNVANDSELKKYVSAININIYNLSTSFLTVKYRFYIKTEFNDKLMDIIKSSYNSYWDVYSSFDVPWYKPWKFGKSYFSSDNIRSKEIYNLLSDLKWKAYFEIRRFFNVYFDINEIFLPSFLTYHTNVKLSLDLKNNEFWHSVGMHSRLDYSRKYNLCVGWYENIDENEGISMFALCGEKRSKKDYLSEIAESDISDTYTNYLTASTFRKTAIKNMTLCNKDISSAIKKDKKLKILKTKSKVEDRMYYLLRFLSEFNGESIDKSDINDFRNELFDLNSFSKLNLIGIEKETKNTYDAINKLLSNINITSEYIISKSNLNLQKMILFISFISLLIAFISLVISSNSLDSLINWLVNLFY